MRSLMLLLALFYCSCVQAQDTFAAWLADLKREALAQGVTQQVLDTAFGDEQPLPRVLELDQHQPEFVQTFSAYVQRRVTPGNVSEGQFLLDMHGELFASVERLHGVPGPVLAALWGMETNYGQSLGSFLIPTALATLAYDGRRSTFFHGQLLDALHILEAGHVAPDGMTGSWAGAMGHMQFMPSTFRAHAVDGDGDGQIDVWQSVADAMYSAGNYLEKSGWKRGAPVAVEVMLPAQFNWEEAQSTRRRPVAEWAGMGVVPAAGGDLPTGAGAAAIVLPQGHRGPAFMVFDNYDVVLQWNRSANYTLAVAQLANRLGGGNDLVGLLEEPAMGREEVMALQQALSEMGYDAGKADGIPGAATAAAVRAYQHAHHLPVDGYASASLIEHVGHVRQAAHPLPLQAAGATGTAAPAAVVVP